MSKIGYNRSIAEAIAPAIAEEIEQSVVVTLTKRDVIARWAETAANGTQMELSRDISRVAEDGLNLAQLRRVLEKEHKLPVALVTREFCLKRGTKHAPKTLMEAKGYIPTGPRAYGLTTDPLIYAATQQRNINWTGKGTATHINGAAANAEPVAVKKIVADAVEAVVAAGDRAKATLARRLPPEPSLPLLEPSHSPE